MRHLVIEKTSFWLCYRHSLRRRLEERYSGVILGDRKETLASFGTSGFLVPLLRHYRRCFSVGSVVGVVSSNRRRRPSIVWRSFWRRCRHFFGIVWQCPPRSRNNSSWNGQAITHTTATTLATQPFQAQPYMAKWWACKRSLILIQSDPILTHVSTQWDFSLNRAMKLSPWVFKPRPYPLLGLHLNHYDARTHDHKVESLALNQLSYETFVFVYDFVPIKLWFW